jgi:hypothetical protein
MKTRNPRDPLTPVKYASFGSPRWVQATGAEVKRGGAELQDLVGVGTSEIGSARHLAHRPAFASRLGQIDGVMASTGDNT